MHKLQNPLAMLRERAALDFTDGLARLALRLDFHLLVDLTRGVSFRTESRGRSSDKPNVLLLLIELGSVCHPVLSHSLLVLQAFGIGCRKPCRGPMLYLIGPHKVFYYRMLTLCASILGEYS